MNVTKPVLAETKMRHALLRLIDFACECAAYAVARVDGDFHEAFEFDV